MQKSLIVAATILIFSGCASRLVDELKRVHRGMDKSAVLDVAGSPAYTFREHDEDNWMYVYYQNDHKWKRQITFNQGKVARVGRPVPSDGWKHQLENAKTMEEYEHLVKEHQKKSSSRP